MSDQPLLQVKGLTKIFVSKRGFPVPKSQTPWQDIYRGTVTQMADGQVIRGADRHQRVAQKSVPRDNH